MANLTISVEDDLLKKARLHAIEQGTSVNAVIRHFLEQYAGVHSLREECVRRVVGLAMASTARRGDRSWTRDELHER